MPADPRVEALPTTQGELASILISNTIALASLTRLVEKALAANLTEEDRKAIEELHERFRLWDRQWERLTGWRDE